jgi:hypothetical protein
MSLMKKILLTGVTVLFLATGTAHAADTIEVCRQRFQAGELQPGDEIGACFARATKNTCDGLDGSDAQVCSDWVDTLAWSTDCRHGWITKRFTAETMQVNPPVEIIGEFARITYDELRKLLKDLPRITRALKACDAYRKCLDDRDTGKVKHCYENDRRWRKFFTGAW